MNELKKELGLVQGVILLTTSLLGTGVFALPELAALAACSVGMIQYADIIPITNRNPFQLPSCL